MAPGPVEPNPQANTIPTPTHNTTPPGPGLRDRVTSTARGVVQPTVRGLVRMGATPNTVTVLGFLLVAGSVPLILTRHWMWAFALFTAGSLSDLLDGSLARMSGKSTRFGAFLDSTLDRTAEGIVLGAIGVVFARDARWWALGAAFLALTASFLISYTRARAEGLGIDSNRGGLMSRPERLFLLAAGLFFSTWFDHVLVAVVAALAVLSLLTVVQRVFHVWQVLRGDTTPP